MRITKLIINNFRSFGPTNTEIELEELSVLVGANSSGKTSAIQALLKLFSPYQRERLIERSDFHIPANENPLDYDESILSIEAIIDFNELESDTEKVRITIPPHFNHMVAGEADGSPYVRIRLKAELSEGNTLEGNIEQGLYYVLSPLGTKAEDEDLQPVKASERSQIQMIYIPATRDPAVQLKNASGTILGRILKGINWPKEINSDIQEKMKQVDEIFDEVNGVKRLREILNSQWRKYHNDFRYGSTMVAFNHADLDSILKKVEVYFEPTETGSKYKVDQLGDGLRSIFYLTLVNSFLEIENEALQDEAEEDKKTYNLQPPVLTLLAVEEPENHISPHLLGRIMKALTDVSKNDNAQVLVATHSPSMIKRVDPQSILHFRIDRKEIRTVVNSIILPDKDKEEEYKYIKAAIMAYPELYFSQLVVLGEGDSEEIILPKIINLLDTDLDQSNISIVPLGGRHVNHFWKLLHQLNIPYLTLLDLDLERYGGGWGRIKYALQQLIQLGYDKRELLSVQNGVLSDDEFSRMHTWSIEKEDERENLYSWVESLEAYGVYYSAPLDIDFMMIESFLDAYKKTVPKHGGPKGVDKEKDSIEYLDRLEKGVRATLKTEGGSGITYSDEQKELMIWYDYFFLGRGKPGTHIMALENIDTKLLIEKLPIPLKKLMKGIKSFIDGDLSE
ncbi:AAA family ATPase [Priestia flexa]|uniref:AAA family ATPase n=1 Tax=Priestia flexa TaxID=86664 RepID=UPI001C96BFA3|nr:AAA family ATPase [Priestia flexa]MBY6086826.1 AAA family ATPase [Priestia flexa]